MREAGAVIFDIYMQVMQQGNHSLGPQQPIIHWQKLPPEWYKCNVDAGFHTELNKTSAGWILRDSSGQFVMAGTAWNQGNCSIVEGEAIALLEAMKQMKQCGITHVNF
ncbi:cytochrome p450 [Trifolium pratense]|uniref:Cytochrome p450 n=1 Tax=Trifolium pratense TaxID=57577 RepID=A0A2K3MEJ3_TRIPR|nr:cytochrome p450 [Trifolium pratense]